MRTLYILAVLLTVSANAAVACQEATATGAQSSERMVQSQNIIIAWSEARDELRGFSNESGEWTSISIEPVEEIRPIVTAIVGCVVLNHKVAAFSGRKGRWDIVELSEDWGPAENGHLPMDLQDEVITAQDGEHLYTFAASNGRWTSPTDPELRSSESRYQLKHLSGQRLRDKLDAWVASQPPHGGFMVQHNAVTISASRQSWREAAEKFLASVDVPEASHAPAALRAGGAADPFSEASRQDVKPLPPHDPAVMQIAAELRNQPSVDDKQRQRLTDLVDNMFEARQAAQIAEVERMEGKLKQIRANIELRQENRKRIVERRVEELLDPAGVTTQWNPSAGQWSSASDGVIGRGPATANAPRGLPAPSPTSPENPSPPPSLNVDLPADSTIADDVRASTEVSSNLRTLQQRCVELLAEISRTNKSISVTEKRLAEKQGPDALSDDERTHLNNALGASQTIKAAQQQAYEMGLADWKSAWEAYQTQLRLKQLDVEEAKTVVEQLLAEIERARKLTDRGLASFSELRQLESRLAIARIDLRRREELLALLANLAVKDPNAGPN